MLPPYLDLPSSSRQHSTCALGISDRLDSHPSGVHLRARLPFRCPCPRPVHSPQPGSALPGSGSGSGRAARAAPGPSPSVPPRSLLLSPPPTNLLLPSGAPPPLAVTTCPAFPFLQLVRFPRGAGRPRQGPGPGVASPGGREGLSGSRGPAGGGAPGGGAARGIGRPFWGRSGQPLATAPRPRQAGVGSRQSIFSPLLQNNPPPPGFARGLSSDLHLPPHKLESSSVAFCGKYLPVPRRQSLHISSVSLFPNPSQTPVLDSPPSPGLPKSCSLVPFSL